MNTPMKPDTDKALINIMDCIGGADGAVSFINLRTLIEDMDSREDDEGAQQIVEVVKRFSRLIDIANKKD